MSKYNESPYEKYYDKHCAACRSHMMDEDKVIECFGTKEDILDCIKVRKFMGK